MFSAIFCMLLLLLIFNIIPPHTLTYTHTYVYMYVRVRLYMCDYVYMYMLMCINIDILLLLCKSSWRCTYLQRDSFVLPSKELNMFLSGQLYTIHCTPYIIHCTLYTIHCTSYIIHYTVYAARTGYQLVVFI